jgi:hypothetical protein
VLKLVKKESLVGAQNAQYVPILVSHMSQQREIPKVNFAFLQHSWLKEVLALVVAFATQDPSVPIVQNVVVTIRFQSAHYKTNWPTSE